MLHTDLSVFDDAAAALEKRDEPLGAVVFYGSSTFTNWGHDRLKAQMRDIPAVNRGFGGSTAEHALYFYDRLVRPLKPRALVWYEGDNDMPCGYSPEEAFFLSERVFAWTRKDFPDAKIFIMPTKICPAREKFRAQADVYRALLKKYAADNDFAFYIDYLPLIFDGDGIRRDIFENDALHFNEKGYAEISSVVYDFLKERL